jgi:hypothetical protein
MNDLTLEDKVSKLKTALHDLPQVEIPTEHFLCEGIYVRQTFIKAHTVFVGKRHKRAHFFMCLKGSAQITYEGGIKTIVAGMTLMCGPGVQRTGITLEDTVFAGVYRTDQTEISKIAEEITEFDPEGRYDVGNNVEPLKIEEG